VTVRVLIVDDVELVRDGLRMVLDAAEAIEVVGEAADGLAAVAQAERLRPDVVLMDVRMPGLDGIEATRRMVALDGAPVRVVMLTTFDLEEYLLEAVGAGVSGFTLKDTPADELIDGIHAIAHGAGLIAPEHTTELIARIMRTLPPAEPPAALTELDRDVLAAVARGLSNTEIASELGRGEDAVERHVEDVLAKLGARDRVQAVVRAYECRVA
jgi:DNA-binding NarL/FixJ family response regulator